MATSTTKTPSKARPKTMTNPGTKKPKGFK